MIDAAALLLLATWKSQAQPRLSEIPADNQYTSSRVPLVEYDVAMTYHSKGRNYYAPALILILK